MRYLVIFAALFCFLVILKDSQGQNGTGNKTEYVSADSYKINIDGSVSFYDDTAPAPSITIKDWVKIVRKCDKECEPGGHCD